MTNSFKRIRLVKIDFVLLADLVEIKQKLKQTLNRKEVKNLLLIIVKTKKEKYEVNLYNAIFAALSEMLGKLLRKQIKLKQLVDYLVDAIEYDTQSLLDEYIPEPSKSIVLEHLIDKIVPILLGELIESEILAKKIFEEHRSFRLAKVLTEKSETIAS